MTTKDNTYRAVQLYGILRRYSPNSSPTENLVDILADAMYWCLWNDHDFDALLSTARMHFECDDEKNSTPSREAEPRQFPIGLRPLGEQLLNLSQEFGYLAIAENGRISFEDYCTLCDEKTKLLAYANLLSSLNADGFLAEEIRNAQQCLADVRERRDIRDKS